MNAIRRRAPLLRRAMHEERMPQKLLMNVSLVLKTLNHLLRLNLRWSLNFLAFAFYLTS